MTRWAYRGAVTLAASLGLASPVFAASGAVANFSFSYVSAYGTDGLSQPYAGPTTTGQSYGTGVAIDPDDPGQKAYTLVEASANVGVGGCRGCFPASSGTTPPSVTIATPGGNNSPTLYGCAVPDNGTIYVGGVDDAASSSLVLAAKIKSNGSLDSSFGKATGLTVAVNERTGALDTNVNGTGELINGNYGEAVLGHIASRGGTATELYLVYGTPGTDAAAFIGYPITGAVADTSSPATTRTGTFTVPGGFVSAQGYTVSPCGQILVSGDTSSGAEMLTMIGGSRGLG